MARYRCAYCWDEVEINVSGKRAPKRLTGVEGCQTCGGPLKRHTLMAQTGRK